MHVGGLSQEIERGGGELRRGGGEGSKKMSVWMFGTN